MKAILVIDMPTNCRSCDKLVRKGCLKGDYRKDERPKQCPLKEMPKKRKLPADMVDYTNYGEEPWFTDGFNACLDELLGEEE